MDPIIKSYPSVPFGELNFCPDHGIAYQQDMTRSVPYDKDYFEKYVRYENTEIANNLNKCRTSITERYCTSVLDIGIGSGEFIKASCIRAYGFDINPVAVRWLREHGLYVDPYASMPDVGGLTFWDSLEHIPNPNALLSLVKKGQLVFVALPVFSDLMKIRQSKHYRPDEHYYYFTTSGMISYMKESGFSLAELSDEETRSGREDIITFVFSKN